MPTAATTALFGILLLAAAVLGQNLFARGYGGNVPPSNYGDLASAYVTSFQIADNENWNDVLHEHMVRLQTKWLVTVHTHAHSHTPQTHVHACHLMRVCHCGGSGRRALFPVLRL